MTLTVPVDIVREVRVRARAHDALTALSDFPSLLHLFPATEQVERLAGRALRWTVEKLGPPPYAQRIIYACRFHVDEAARRIWWEPTDDNVADDRIHGEVTLREDGSTTLARLSAQAEIVLDGIPFFAKRLAPPIVRAEFERLTDKFVQNIKRSLEHELA
ncbi:MAG: SRPBCC family protein [Bacteroidota bacterium]